MSKSFTDRLPGIAVRIVCLLAPAAAFAAAPVSEPPPADMARRLERIEQALDNKGLLDLMGQIQTLEQEIQRLRGEVEVQTHTIEELRNRQRDLYTDIDRRMQRLEGGGAAPQPPADSTAGSEGPPLETLSPVATQNEPETAAQADSALTVEIVETPPAAAHPATAQPNTPPAPADPDTATAGTDPVRARAVYQNAFKLLKQSLYEQAIKAFRDYLAAYPDSEFADNAQYWLGETFYVTRDFEQAIAEYGQVVKKFPESQKITDALLKIGYSYHELGRLDEAKLQLEYLKARFPGTTAARLAEDRLKKINSAPRPESATR